MFELIKRNSRPNMLKMLDLVGHDMDSVSRIMDDLFHFHGVPTMAGIDKPDFSPSLNFSEKENKYVASLELPGISQDDIKMSLSDDNILTITGEKKIETTEENECYCVKECHYGLFRRDIPLPLDIEKDGIEATFENGILKLDLPKAKKEKKKSKKIEIKKSK